MDVPAFTDQTRDLTRIYQVLGETLSDASVGIPKLHLEILPTQLSLLYPQCPRKQLRSDAVEAESSNFGRKFPVETVPTILVESALLSGV